METKIIEHEPEIVTTHGTFKQKDLDKVVVEEAERKEPDKDYCPLRHTRCSKLCALHCDEGCSIITGGDTVNVSGVCPATDRPCKKTCIMLINGKCALYQGRKEE